MEGMEAQATNATIEAMPDKAEPKQESKQEPILDQIKPKSFKLQLNGKKEGDIREEEITEDRIRKYLGIPPEEPWPDKPYLEEAILKQYKVNRDIEYKRNGLDREKIELANLINKMSTNFGQFMQEDLGMNFDELALHRVQQLQQLQQMSPEQRMALQQQQDIEDRERRIMEYEQRLEQQQMEQQTEYLFQKYKQGVGKAIQNLNFPMDQALLALAADHLEDKVKNNEPINFEEAARYTINKFKIVSKNIISQFKGDQLLNYLGDDLVREITKALNTKNSRPSTQVQGKVDINYKPQSPQDVKQMSKDDYEAFIEQRKRQLDGK